MYKERNQTELTADQHQTSLLGSGCPFSIYVALQALLPFRKCRQRRQLFTIWAVIDQGCACLTLSARRGGCLVRSENRVERE